MIELSLILAVAIAGLGLAGYLVRWVFGRPLGDAEMNRVANQVQKVAESFARRQGSTILALAGVCTGLVFLAYGLRRNTSGPIGELETGVWLTVSCAAGAISAILSGQFTTFLFTRVAVRVASGARRSIDQALAIALRSGAIVGLVTSTLTTFGGAALVLSMLLYHGALVEDRPAAALVTPIVPHLLLGFSLGACFVAILAQLSGGAFAKASDIGSEIGGREAGLGGDDPENPAAIANIAGDGVGPCVGQSTSSVAACASEDLAAMLLGANLFAENQSLKSALAVILFPLLARSFGIVGAGFAVMIVRTDDTENPDNAIFRGLLVATILHAVGVAGASKWLLPTIWIEVAGALAVGVVAGLLLSPMVNYYTSLRTPSRELSEASRTGPALNVLTATVAGLDAVIGPGLLLVGMLFGAHAIGEHTHLQGGGAFGIAMAMVGLAGPSAYLASVSSAAAISDAACGIVGMTVGRDRPDVRGRLVVLDSVGTSSKAFARAHGAATGALGSFLLVLVFLHSGTSAFVESSLPILFVAGIGGLGAATWLAARSLSGALQAARRIVDEVRRQLGGRRGRAARAPLDSGEASARVDQGPCVEIASRLALRSMILPGVGAIALPVGLIVGLRLVARGAFGVPATGTVAVLELSAVLFCSFGALGLAIVGALFANAKRYISSGAHGGQLLADEAGARAENPTYVAASVGDSVGDALKDVALPMLQLFARLLPVLVLVVEPFLA